MQTFLKRLAAFIAIQLLLLFVLLANSTTDSGDYMGSLLDKRARLFRSTPPKLVFVGGSSLAFGLNSERLQQELDRPVVNMGLHAGLGVEFALNECPVSALHPGDLVVLSFEYENFATREPDAQTVFNALKVRPGAVSSINWMIGKTLLDQSFGITTSQLRSFLAARTRSASDTASLRMTPYRRSGFNEFGDVVAHLSLPVPIAMREHTIDREAALGLTVPDPWLETCIEILNRFNTACQARKATVLFIYPAYPRPVFAANRAAIDKLHRKLKGKLQFTVLGQPSDSEAPPEFFFDTHYHLNREGIEWRRRELVRYLRTFSATHFAYSLPSGAESR